MKRVLRIWRLERFDDVKVTVSYQKALQAEVLGFTEMKGDLLFQEVVHEWEDIINRVAKSVVGEKTIVCGKSARWWDNDKISHRRKVYKKVVSGRKELWDDYVSKSRKQRGRSSLATGMRRSRRLIQTLRGVGRSFGLLSVGEQKVSTGTSFVYEQSWSCWNSCQKHKSPYQYYFLYHVTCVRACLSVTMIMNPL